MTDMGYKGNYVQCKLQRNLPDGGTHQHVAWLPENFATLNKFLKLKNDLGDWEDGWQVIETWGTRTVEHVERQERVWAHQRSVTDI